MARKALPQIDADGCTGCGRCVAACPPQVLWLITDRPDGMGRKRAHLQDKEHCPGCTHCALACPFDVIDMVRSDTRPRD